MDSNMGVYRVTTPKVDQVLAKQHFEMPALPVKSVCGSNDSAFSNRFLVIVYEDDSFVVFWAERNDDISHDSVMVMPTPAPLHLLSDVGLITSEDVYEQVKIEARLFESETEKRELGMLETLLRKYSSKMPGLQVGSPPSEPVDPRNLVKLSEALTPSESEILIALVQANGKPVTYDYLIGLVKEDSDAYDRELNLNSLHVHKCRLAKKLKPNWKITIVRGIGYTLTEM